MKTKFAPGELPMYFGARSRNFEYARQNREKATPAETALWEAVKNKKLQGLKFRRQHPIDILIVDFYCPETNLAIEIDGKYHQETEQQAYDQNRSAMLKEAGTNEIRFENEEVLNNLAMVLEKIIQATTP